MQLVAFLPGSQFPTISNNRIFLIFPFIRNHQIQCNPFHIPGILTDEMLTIKRTLNKPISLPCFPLDGATLRVIPVGDGKLILNRMLQLRLRKVDEASPMITLNYRKFTLNQDNFSEFSMTQFPSWGTLPTTYIALPYWTYFCMTKWTLCFLDDSTLAPIDNWRSIILFKYKHCII